uniref:Immunoglobulin domain-containing protein n=3 Tax=Cyprinus carpio TaxID=7962 RepID=A0A8C1GYB2_CYPCA
MHFHLLKCFNNSKQSGQCKFSFLFSRVSGGFLLISFCTYVVALPLRLVEVNLLIAYEHNNDRMRTTQLLLFFPLVWCQTTESLTDKRVNLGGNVTLDCQIGVKEIYWIFQKLTDSPVLILRTFTSDSASSHTLDKRLKGKYSSLTLSRLFISNITSDEIGIYYCAKLNKTLQISEGFRLYTTESAQDQNQTESNNYNQPHCKTTPNFPQILTITSLLLNTVLIIAITGLLMLKLKKPRKSRQPQNVEPVSHEDLNTAQYSEIELSTYSGGENPIQINSTYQLLQKPKPHPRQS